MDNEMIINELEEYSRRNSDCSIIHYSLNFTIYFLKTMVKYDLVLSNIEKPYLKSMEESFKKYLLTIAYKVSEGEIVNELAKGNIIAIYDNDLWIIRASGHKEKREVGEVVREASYEGALLGFIEEVDTNINLIRQCYKTKDLSIENFEVGTESKKDLYVLYNNKIVDRVVLQKINEKIGELSIKTVDSVSQLQKEILKGQWLFPRLLTTERPDRSIHAIKNGRVVILLEGTPMSLIAPTTFNEYMTTVDEDYLMPIPSVFLIIIRYIALIIGIIAPASYVAFVAYNPEVLRVQLALSIAGSRSGVPYAAYIEVLFMLIMMEFLVEASIRLPKTIGQTATTVGGLILGQAATAAGLVSDIMIIIVAAVAISNFVIPITSMNLAVRVLKYYILFLTIIGGIVGFMTGVTSITFYLISLHSFNTPFLNPMGFKFQNIVSLFRKDR